VANVGFLNRFTEFHFGSFDESRDIEDAAPLLRLSYLTTNRNYGDPVALLDIQRVSRSLTKTNIGKLEPGSPVGPIDDRNLPAVGLGDPSDDG
jgi:hypothetical protein